MAGPSLGKSRSGSQHLETRRVNARSYIRPHKILSVFSKRASCHPDLMLRVAAGILSLNGVAVLFPDSEKPSLLRAGVVPSRVPIEEVISASEDRLGIFLANPRRIFAPPSQEHGMTWEKTKDC